MAGLVHARTPRRGALLWALAASAVLALGQAPALAKSPHASGASFYVVKSAKVKCKAHYTKQTVTLRVRRHRRWTRVHQIRCVYTGNGSHSGGGGGGGSGGRAVSFPLNLPTAAVSVSVIPTAVTDTYSTSANQSLSVGADSGVLANDDGLGLGATLLSGASHGTLTLARSGAFHYAPNAGYSGIDHFDYRSSDGSGESSAPAEVTIAVTPIALARSAYSVAAASTLNVGAPGLLAGAVGSGLHTELVSAPSGGSATVNDDGSFSYTGAPGFAGVDSFQIDVVDGAGQASNTVTVTIDVGAAPPSPVGETFSGAVGNTELQVGGARGSGAEVYQGGASALAGDSDPNGGTISATAAVIQTAQGGSVSLAANGSFTYEPPAGYSGPSDSFSYQVDTSEGTNAQAAATINFTGARVWYVDQSAAPGGTGTSASPFNSLAAVSAPSSSASAGDVIFVFPGSYSSGVTLAQNEALLGAPAGLTVSSEDLRDPAGSNPVITNAGGAGVSLVGGDTLSAVTVSATSGAGISVSGANTFTITSSVTVANAGGDGVDITGGSGAASVAATISGSAGHSLDVQSRAGGTLVFSGPITDGADGVLLQSNTGATINFTGPITSATTNSHPAFQALGGGTISATASGNALSAAGAAALDVESTAIGSGGLQFQSISAGTSPSSGPADGVILSTTGPGTLTVTGAQGLAGSGGTIQGTTTAGLSASASGRVSLAEMLFEPASGDGVSAAAVPALVIFFSTITGGDSGIAASGDASTLQTPQGFDIESNAFSGQHGAAISLTYAGTTIGYLQSNKIGSESPVLAGSTTGDGIDISPSAAGSITAQIADNVIDQIDQGDGIDAQASSGALLNLTLANNAVQMDSASSQDGVLVGSAGSVCLNPTGNTVVAAGSSASDNAMEVDQLGTTSVFEIQGYDGISGAAAFLSGANLLSIAAGGGGSPAVATPDGSNGFTSVPGPSFSCPAPPPNSGNI